MTVQNLTKALEDATQMIHGYLSRISDLESQLVKEAARTADYKQRYEQISNQGLAALSIIETLPRYSFGRKGDEPTIYVFECADGMFLRRREVVEAITNQAKQVGVQ